MRSQAAVCESQERGQLNGQSTGHERSNKLVGQPEETAMTVAVNPIDLATGVLVERYQLTVERAITMLEELASTSEAGVDEYASWLVARCGDSTVRLKPADEPAHVRRAMAYIAANADSDIGIENIARAARVGPRGLQSAFQKSRGQTPMAFLRSVRMNNAHVDLVAGDRTKGDTVSEIAARRGFTNAGRFSVEYRKIFGCSPSYTLHR
ncbi:helix-turn-helix transcriptional regulator [Actinomycetospora rhizophila]|uniref:Helix-turn-helix transcriptional regulator n=1 Tax=Actinomycetospora rhizophila TaxID=1416876 RepID=A0ABV9ZQ25_9PSEU